jgi:hypothetical protein
MSKPLKLEGASDDLLNIILGFMSSLENPLVYIGDLVQNAIDARATNIKIELIKNGKITEKIVCSDNGVGFEQSFEYYSRNIGNSLKKHAANLQKLRAEGNLRGEYCIGLYGFGSVASELEIINISKDNGKLKDIDGKVIVDNDLPLMRKCRRMRLYKKKLDAIVDEEGDFDNVRESHGVTCTLSKLTDSTKNKFTVPKIVDYISSKNRSDLLKKSLKIEVTDGTITQKVEPFVYKGNKVTSKTIYPNQDKDLRVRGFGELASELYYHSPRKGSTIIVTVKGEPIYSNLCKKIEGFDKYPWNSEMVSGTIEYDRLQKQPGRESVQKDVFYDAFIDLLKILEKEVEIKVKEIEDSLQLKEDDKFFVQLYDVFGKIRKDTGLGVPESVRNVVIKGPLERVEVFPDKESVQAYGVKTLYVRAYDSENNELTELDGMEFYWKVTGKLGRISPQGNDAIFDADHITGVTEVTITARDTKSSKDLSSKIEITIVNPISCGALHRVKISPGIVAVSTNKHRDFVAIAEDMNGNAISKGIKYSWIIVNNTSKGSKINKDHGDSIIFSAGKVIGQAKIQLTAQQGGIIKEDFALIDVKETSKAKKIKKDGTELPRLQKISSFDHPMWHSRLDDKEKVLYYNIAHGDYAEVQSNTPRRYKYIASLYAKELTLAECKHLGVEHYGERFLEIMSKLDKYWKLTN